MKKCKMLAIMLTGVLTIATVPTSAFVMEEDVHTNDTLVTESAIEISTLDKDVLMDTSFEYSNMTLTNALSSSENNEEEANNENSIILIDQETGETEIKEEETKTENKEKSTKKSSKKSSKKNKKKEKSEKDDSDNGLEYVGTFKVTAYCNYGTTASGTTTTAGRTIAADTSVLPFGTEVVFNDHTYVVEDRGGAIKGNRIDLYMSSYNEAINWGVRYCEVYVKSN